METGGARPAQRPPLPLRLPSLLRRASPGFVPLSPACLAGASARRGVSETGGMGGCPLGYYLFILLNYANHQWQIWPASLRRPFYLQRPSDDGLREGELVQRTLQPYRLRRPGCPRPLLRHGQHRLRASLARLLLSYGGGEEQPPCFFHRQGCQGAEGRQPPSRPGRCLPLPALRGATARL